MGKTTAFSLLVVSVLCLSCSEGKAETTVTMDHNDGPAATEAFRFKTVPGPRQSAAIGAAFTVLDGTRDAFSATPDVLHDGKVADDEDQPDSSFFFQNGSDGGRWLVDLGKVIPVREIDTYSWHTDARAPQVYKVYGSDGGGAGFTALPHRPQDPTQAGWKLLAAVDTRQKFGLAGGQYGVGVTDPAGIVGSYRYLLFDVARTTEANPFGNTFYTEVAVTDRDAPANPAPARSAHPRETSTYDEKGLHLAFISDAPAFDPKLKERLVQTFFTVYPEMSAAFNPNAPKGATIFIDSRYHGAAVTMGNVIHIDPVWYRRNPEDLDLITHEAMHIVQQYHRPVPVWLMEGIADYARYQFGVHNNVSGWTMPDRDVTQSYTDSYRITARFLAWLEKHVKPGIVVTLDKALRDGTYTAGTWKQQTGKTVDELWQDYGKNPGL